MKKLIFSLRTVVGLFCMVTAVAIVSVVSALSAITVLRTWIDESTAILVTILVFYFAGMLILPSARLPNETR